MKPLAFSFDSIRDAIYDFFHPSLDGYTNFEISEAAQKTLPILIFAIFLGVFFAAFYTLYIRSVLGELVRKLNTEQIFFPDEAKTLEELGFSKNIFILQALKNPHSLRRVLRSVEADAFYAQKTGGDYRYTPKTEHFYLPEKDRYTAEMRFGKRKTEFSTVFFVLLGIVLCELLIFSFLPELVTFFDNAISLFSVKGNTLN